MFKLEFTFATWAEAQAAMATMAGIAPVAAEAPAQPKQEAKKPPKPQPAPETPAPTPAATVTPPAPAPAEPAAESPSKGMSLEEVRAKLAAIAQKGKSDGVKKLIADAGFPNLTAIPAEMYPAILEKAEAL